MRELVCQLLFKECLKKDSIRSNKTLTRTYRLVREFYARKLMEWAPTEIIEYLRSTYESAFGDMRRKGEVFQIYDPIRLTTLCKLSLNEEDLSEFSIEN